LAFIVGVDRVNISYDTARPCRVVPQTTYR